jgi:hypothetical protein
MENISISAPHWGQFFSIIVGVLGFPWHPSSIMIPPYFLSLTLLYKKPPIIDVANVTSITGGYKQFFLTGF